jgi:N-acetylmuramoyl-L-alanine amidase
MKFLVFLIAALAVSVNAQSGPCANIRTRAQWGARSANTNMLATIPPNSFVVHHTAGARCSTVAACDQQMRNIQSWQMDGNGWSDIGYNFCIGDTAQIYEGRGKVH